MSDSPDVSMILTTDPVDLPGVEPADPPTELVPGQLWHGGCPVDFDWVRATGIDLVLDLADADARLVGQGHQALVHCTFGRNRSGLMATLVVRELLGLSGADALAHVRERRRGVADNAAFADWLTTLPAPTSR